MAKSGTDKQKLGMSANSFAWDIYKEIAKDEAADGQIFISPFSALSALAMTYIGARGNTAKQMKSVLHFDDVEDIDLHKTFQALNALIESDEGDEYKMCVANRLFASDTYTFLEAFMNETRKYYSAEAQGLNFNNPDEARQKINTWVQDQTEDKITNLLPEGAITKLTKLVLASAVYMKADWMSEFEGMDTHSAWFFMKTGVSMEVSMMCQTTYLDYCESEKFKSQVLVLPYKNWKLSMVIILPSAESNLSSLESELDPSALMTLMKQVTRENVACYIPKFKFDDHVDMKSLLDSLGMTNIFDKEKADLSGMDGTGDLVVTAIHHKAFVQVILPIP